MSTIQSRAAWTGRLPVLVTVLAALFASLGLLAAGTAHAATLTVNDTADPGSGGCNATECTLREAINEANATTADTISFDIPEGEDKTIKPTSPLPVISERLTIDGYSQPGADPNTLTTGTNADLKIELNGEDAGGSSAALSIRASGCVIKGLVINRFGGEGIQISGSDSKVEGNFIGSDSSGLGSNVSSLDQGNHLSGVLITQGASGNIIGGTTPENRNVIAANNGAGVRISSSASSNKVQGNLIGVAKNGGLLGNSRSGVEIFEASENFVGGNVSEASNTIAGNGIGFLGGDGVTVSGAGSAGNRILRNSINVNEDLGIDLVGGTESSNGTTRNDSKDPDTGPNGLQNSPFLTSATNSGTQTNIAGSLGSKPDQSFVLRFFSNPPNTGEGNTFIGQKKVSTGASGTASFTFTPAQALQGQAEITATATDQAGNTSEFSKARSLTQR